MNDKLLKVKTWLSIILICLVILLIVALGVAMIVDFTKHKETPTGAKTITVVGVGEEVVAPKSLAYNVYLSASDFTYDGAVSKLNEKISTMKNLLSQSGVTDKGIIKQNFNSSKGMYDGGESYTNGSSVSQNFIIAIEDFSKIQQIKQSMGAKGFTMADYYGVQNNNDIENNNSSITAIEEGIADAKSKAEKIANNIGKEAGDIISVTPVTKVDQTFQVPKGDTTYSTEIASKVYRIIAEVTVSFALK